MYSGSNISKAMLQSDCMDHMVKPLQNPSLLPTLVHQNNAQQTATSLPE